MNQISSRDRVTSDANKAPPPETGARSGQSEAARPPAPRRPRRLLRPILMIGGVVVVIVGVGYVWLTGGSAVSTDDSYVEAAEVNATTDVSGIVAKVLVSEGEHVKQGQELFRLRQHHYQIMLDGARAKLAETAENLAAQKEDYQRMLKDVATQDAVVAEDKSNFGRYAALIHGGGVTRAEYDDAHFKLDADQAKLESLQAQAQTQLARLGGDINKPIDQMPTYKNAAANVAEAQRQLNRTTVYAPFNGIATNVESLQPGHYLTAAAAAFGIVSTDDIWITAQYKETQLTYVRDGQPVSISVDAYPGHSWKGVVQSIAPATGSQFSLLPAENSSGNWVKVVQRIPVRIKITEGPKDLPLRAGMSVEVTVETGHKRHFSDLF